MPGLGLAALNRMALRAFLAFFLSLNFIVFANAGIREICIQNLSSEPESGKLIDTFSSISKQPLFEWDDFQEKTLNQHPLANLAKTSKKQNFNFILEYLTFEPLSINSRSTGEEIQTRYIYNILKKAFPTATFETSHSHALRESRPNLEPSQPSETVDIQIDVRDVGEFSGNQLTWTLPMELLKIANAETFFLRSIDFRKYLKIDADKKILGVYLQKHLREPKTDRAIFEQVRILATKTSANKIFLSQGGRFSIHIDVDSNPLFKEYRILKLSEMSRADLRSNEKMLILNDTKGFMPFLYRLSDVALVLGPINFLEPLIVGTPTAWAWPSFISQHHDPKYLSENIQFAKSLGGFSSTQDLSRWANNAQILMEKNEPIANPKSTRMSNTDTPLRNLLSKLHQIIRSQLE